MNLILASASPRRRDLLEEAGYTIRCVVSGAEEIEDNSYSPADLAVENAMRKAALVSAAHPDDIVLAADTVVWREGKFFGKPADMEDAFRMLSELAGHTHEVVTGVAIYFSNRGPVTFSDSSLVTFHPLNDTAIHDYLASIHPLDKAGAYAAQNDNGRIIKNIEGSVTNVIGLPVERIREALSRLSLGLD